MAKKPVKKVTAKKTVAAKKPWPTCSYCSKQSVLTWRENGKEKHACANPEHYKKGYQPKKQKPSGIAPGTNGEGLKKVVKKAKKKVKK